jgi:NADH-quinone oxidoreductase subunit J
MGFEKFLFYVFALILIFAAVRVITVRNSVHAALFLVLAFFTSAALWLLIEAEFLAITMVLVYVGAVMVLFLFVVMMLDLNTQPLREGFIKYLPVGATVAVIIVIEMVLVLGSGYFSSESTAWSRVRPITAIPRNWAASCTRFMSIRLKSLRSFYW